jgi:protein MYSM1
MLHRDQRTDTIFSYLCQTAQPRGAKRKKAPVDNDNGTITTTTTTAETSTDPTQSLEATTNSTTNENGDKPVKVKKAKKPLPPGFNTGLYTESEEILFLEGLNLYGRGWNDVSDSIK